MTAKYREPMCGWPHDAHRLDCGCVRTGIVWHPCDQHRAELTNELDEA